MFWQDNVRKGPYVDGMVLIGGEGVCIDPMMGKGWLRLFVTLIFVVKYVSSLL